MCEEKNIARYHLVEKMRGLFNDGFISNMVLRLIPHGR